MAAPGWIHPALANDTSVTDPVILSSCKLAEARIAPLSIEEVITMMRILAIALVLLMLLGIALRNRILIFAQAKTWILAVFTLLSAAVLACGTILRGDALELCLMCGSDYGNLFWFMLNAVSGSALVLGISMLLFRDSREGRSFSTAAITYVGQHTLGVYLLHKNLQLDLIIPWIHIWLAGPQLLVACIATCISFAASLALCALIEKFVPQLLGQFPKYPG